MRVARFLLGFILLLAILAMAAYILRLPLAGFAVRSAMASAGLENPKARVTELSLSGVRLAQVSAGPSGAESFRFDAIEADYKWRRLWPARRIEAVRIGPGAVRFVLSPEGRFSLPGAKPRSGEGGASLPFSKLTLNDIGLIINTPEGQAAGVVSASYDVAQGGRASVALSTKLAGFQAIRTRNASVKSDITFADDGTVSLIGAMQGDVITTQAALRGIDVSLTGSGQSWRTIAAGDRDGFIFEALMRIHAATIPVESAASLSALSGSSSSAFVDDQISSLGISGALALKFSKNGFTLEEAQDDGLPVLRSDTGIVLALSGFEGKPIYSRLNGAERATFAYTLKGARIEADGVIDAERLAAGWRIKAPVSFGEFRSDALSVDRTFLTLDVTTNAAGFNADISVTSNIRKAFVGRLNISDAPVDASVKVDLNQAARRAVVFQANDCIAFDRVKMTIEEQDTEAVFSYARLCAKDNSEIAVFDWSGPVRAVLSGALSAGRGRYRLGQTRIVGRPPRVNFQAVYLPDVNQTSVAGDINGGAMTLNDMLNFSRADGKFELTLDKEIIKSTAHLDHVRIAQNLELPLVAPVIGDGEVALVDKNATFRYVLHTPAGERLGAGKGVHNVATARGSSIFNFDNIEFAPGGLQPDHLAPVLKGVIGVTTGGASGSANFSWTSAGVTSAADIVFADLTFEGPTLVVSKTIGVNGNIQFANLWPVSTAGVQTITVSGVDLDALQLAEGEISFELPGDETLRVERAVFPWFGGELGVYDATASIAGGEAIAPLRASNIDLAQVFEYADIDGLSGDGVISGVLPLVVEGGKARIENGVMNADGPGAIRYQGQAGEKAAEAGEQAQIAFDILRDLRYNSLSVIVNGPLDGRLEFQLKFEGTGEVSVRNAQGRVPVLYNITLDAALLELLNQANLSRSIELQIERGLRGDDEAK